MHSYTHHLGDWASHTRGLSFVQLAAYHLLVEAYYISEKPLPGELRQVYRIVGATTHHEIVAINYVLHRFFAYDATRDCWLHSRCDKEIAKHQEHCQQQREKIAKRWGSASLLKQTKKAINSEMVSETQIQGITPTHRPSTSAHVNGHASDTVGIPAELPYRIPVTFNTSNTHFLNAESVAETCVRVCVDKGLKVGKDDSLLLALIHRGAGIADFTEAAALAASQGKGFAFAAGVVNNRLSVASEYAREGTKTGLGRDPREVWYQDSVAPKKSP